MGREAGALCAELRVALLEGNPEKCRELTVEADRIGPEAVQLLLRTVTECLSEINEEVRQRCFAGEYQKCVRLCRAVEAAGTEEAYLGVFKKYAQLSASLDLIRRRTDLG